MARRPLESKFQKHLIDSLGVLFPGCWVLKNDSSYWQGIPDLLILWHDRWAMLEVKRSLDEGYEPNQEYNIDVLNQMSFSAMICPENEEEVINALQLAFRSSRTARVSQR